MTIQAPRSPDLETRRRVVTGMVRLSLWYVRRLLARRQIAGGDLPRALVDRVNLYKLTSLWDGKQDPRRGEVDPAWNGLAAELSRLVAASPETDTSALEEKGLALLWPLLEKRLPEDVGPPDQRAHECWIYELEWDGMGVGPGLKSKLSNPYYLVHKLRKTLRLPEGPPRNASLHFENAYVPASPFTRPADMRRTLRDLIADVRRNHPSVRELWFNTWLNSHPAFQAFFPPRWFGSAVRSVDAGDYSWWGQFVTRTGDFNEKVAAQLRASGKWPYPAVLCHAPMREVDAFLASRAGQK